MVSLLDNEAQLAFHAVVPHGNILKCVSELLMRCAPHVAVTVDRMGMSFVACDPTSGRLIHVVLGANDLLDFRFLRQHPLRCTLESSSLHAVFHQLRPRRLLGPPHSLRAVPAEGRRRVVRHRHRSVWLAGGLFRSATPHEARDDQRIQPRAGRGVHYSLGIPNTRCGGAEQHPAPRPWWSTTVCATQRILREYKNLSKRIILTGNQSYIHIATDARVSLHRSDNLFGTPDPREDDVSVELSINTLGRILKVTQFSPHVRIVCESGQPVRLTSSLGSRSENDVHNDVPWLRGSHVDVFIQPEALSTRDM